MAQEDVLKGWMKDQNVWHPKLYKVLKSKNIETLEDFGKLQKKEYNAVLKESKFAKPSTLKSVYDAAKPKKAKKKKKATTDDKKEDNGIYFIRYTSLNNIHTNQRYKYRTR